MGIFKRKNTNESKKNMGQERKDDKSYSFENFKLSDLKKLEAKEFDQDYAVWWPSEHEKTFTGSKTNTYSIMLFNAIEKHPSVFIGYLLLSLEVINEFQKISLPDEERFFVLMAPYNQKILLLISKKRGIQFLFNKTTPQSYRESFLEYILLLFNAIKMRCVNENINEEESNLTEAKEKYYNEINKLRKKEEKSEFTESFGLYECVDTMINSLKQLNNSKNTTESPKVEFISTPVSEDRIREMAKKPKDVKLLIEENGSVSGICKDCNKDVFLNDKDELLWFICPNCLRLTFYPLGNVQRDIQFAIKDNKPFEVELYYLKEMPEGLEHPFQTK